MAKIKVKRGIEANIGNIILEDGEFAVTTDTKKLYVGIAGANMCIDGVTSMGDMLKSIYDTDNDGIVDKAEAVEWSGVLNKPSAFTPSAHNHDNIYMKKAPLSWNELKGV